MLVDVSASPTLSFLCWSCFGAGLVGQTLCCSQHASAHGRPCAAAAFPAPSPSHLTLLCCARYHRRLLGRDFDLSWIPAQPLRGAFPGAAPGSGVCVSASGALGSFAIYFLGLCSRDVLEQELFSSSECQAFP